MNELIQVSHYLPTLSTLISAMFAVVILSRYSANRQARHLLWWGIGIAVYGAGTAVESLTTLFGWNVIFFKFWYIVGALLGGAPLAIGTIYLLFGKRAGDLAVAILAIVAGTTSVFVILSPVNYNLVDATVLNSKVLGWQKIRLVSPFVNSLAALFLIGGAFYSAGRWFRHRDTRHRFIGNLYIAIGAILPGVGGMFSRMGHTEVLYLGELIGIIMIWIGYGYCRRNPKPVLESTPLVTSET